MSTPPSPHVRPYVRFFRAARNALLALLGVSVLVWLACFTWVAAQPNAAASQRADAAVVLGAAVWANGKPSPVFARRIHTAAELFLAGRVRLIATTGGVAEGKHGPTEGDTARRVLMEQGVPEGGIVVENRSRTTWQNLANLRALLTSAGVRSVLIVSDGYHLARALRMARDMGFTAWGVGSDGTPWQSVRASRDHWVREATLLGAYLFERPFL